MKIISLSICLITLALASTGCGPSRVKDIDGHTLPAVGAEARLVEKQGWVAKDEAAVAELMMTPKIDLRTFASPEEFGRAIDRILQERATQMIRQGKVFRVTPGTKVRVVGYLNDDRLPMRDSDRSAAYAKIAVMDGTLRREGFTVAGGIAE